jgi:hypothetical protein
MNSPMDIRSRFLSTSTQKELMQHRLLPQMRQILAALSSHTDYLWRWWRLNLGMTVTSRQKLTYGVWWSQKRLSVKTNGTSAGTACKRLNAHNEHCHIHASKFEVEFKVSKTKQVKTTRYVKVSYLVALHSKQFTVRPIMFPNMELPVPNTAGPCKGV